MKTENKSWYEAVKIINAVLGVFILIRIAFGNPFATMEFIVLSYLCLFHAIEVFYKDGRLSSFLFFLKSKESNAA